MLVQGVRSCTPGLVSDVANLRLAGALLTTIAVFGQQREQFVVDFVCRVHPFFRGQTLDNDSL